MCLAGNVDYLEDDDAGLDDVPLDSESELWSDVIDSTLPPKHTYDNE